ncbi:hypothetical protein H6P81_004044 [Aristolochia fimbriata]|uniref:Glutaredoxin-dependent peroxiredoxin n=1 Tax=Aristolochia fimbriata TaxID=158543 RepID=A0AAV7FH37_ARIFI|nr:hypothetical protein H6P81_004044 [Aristolochia fimbriata]
MASALVKGSGSAVKAAAWAFRSRAFASVAVGSDLISAAPDVTLQKARTWDEGVESNFSTTPLKDIFKEKKVVIFGLPGAFTGVCSKAHVPSYKNNLDKLKAKGVDSVICVSVNDPYVMNGWAEKLEAKEAIEFYGDFDGSFHKSLELDLDLSKALLGHRSQRWSAYVVDGKVKVLNVEKVPSEFKQKIKRPISMVRVHKKINHATRARATRLTTSFGSSQNLCPNQETFGARINVAYLSPPGIKRMEKKLFDSFLPHVAKFVAPHKYSSKIMFAFKLVFTKFTRIAIHDNKNKIKIKKRGKDGMRRELNLAGIGEKDKKCRFMQAAEEVRTM